jgi:hypothetical protein
VSPCSTWRRTAQGPATTLWVTTMRRHRWLWHQEVMAATIPSLCLVLLVILYTTIIVRGADTESDAIGNHLPPSVHKIEFPKFDGTGDPMVGSTIANTTSLSMAPRNISVSSTGPSIYWMTPNSGIIDLSSMVGHPHGCTSSSWCTPGLALRSRSARSVNWLSSTAIAPLTPSAIGSWLYPITIRESPRCTRYNSSWQGSASHSARTSCYKNHPH